MAASRGGEGQAERAAEGERWQCALRSQVLSMCSGITKVCGIGITKGWQVEGGSCTAVRMKVKRN